MAFSDALLGAVKAPFKGAADFFGASGKAAGPMGAVGRGALKTVEVPAGAGLRATQGLLYVAGPFLAIGTALFGAKKLHDHLEKRNEAPDFVASNIPDPQTQALLDANPLDTQSAMAINAQVDQMLAAQNMIQADQANLAGTLAEAPQMGVGAQNG